MSRTRHIMLQHRQCTTRRHVKRKGRIQLRWYGVMESGLAKVWSDFQPSIMNAQSSATRQSHTTTHKHAHLYSFVCVGYICLAHPDRIFCVCMDKFCFNQQRITTGQPSHAFASLCTFKQWRHKSEGKQIQQQWDLHEQFASIHVMLAKSKRSGSKHCGILSSLFIFSR